MKLTPAANQIAPRSGGNVDPEPVERAHRIGGQSTSTGRAPATSANVRQLGDVVGTISRRLMPTPPPMPVTKNAGGPPIGADSAPNTKNEM